jgi:hypothetical protein
MPRTTIQQFRASLTGRGPSGATVRAYLTLGRRPDLAVRMQGGEWAAWPSAASHPES